MPTVGRYEVERLIASGGMAEVHLGHDKTLLRKVALKLPHSHLWREARARERFLQEGRIIASLSHENIVHIYDVGEHESRLYLAMEFVSGESLDVAIKRLGPLPPLTVLALLLQILRGLQAAHSQGILHRDIKPANLILTPDGHLKMADFGLSRLLGSESLSLSGQFIGTPRYTAPEVAAGGEHLPQSDVFAAGMVALELLAGHPVVDLDNAQASLLAIREGRFATFAESGPSLPPLIKKILQQLVELDPTKRPNAHTALTALESYAWEHRLKWDPARIASAWSDLTLQGQREKEELIPLWESEIRALEKEGQVATARKQTMAFELWSQRKFPGVNPPSDKWASTSNPPLSTTEPNGQKAKQPLGRGMVSGIGYGIGLALLLILIFAAMVRLGSSPSEAIRPPSTVVPPPTPAPAAASISPQPMPDSKTTEVIAADTVKAISPPTTPKPVPKRNAKAFLRVLTKPGYATVMVNQVDRGVSPTAWIAVPAGKVQLQLKRSGCLPDSSEVLLAPAESLEIRRELTRVVENPR
jgi:tRNA A-37 threonylcarbamoyl transferase component Bud32